MDEYSINFLIEFWFHPIIAPIAIFKQIIIVIVIFILNSFHKMKEFLSLNNL